MSRGRSTSPHPLRDEDVDMDNTITEHVDKPNAKVVIVTNLTRNVVEAHLQTIFGFYGELTKVDLPLFGKSGQNRGKAALEYSDAHSAHKAASHMGGGQLDGATIKVEFSDLPVRSRSHSARPQPPPLPRGARNGRPARSYSRSFSRSRSPRRGGYKRARFDRFADRDRERERERERERGGRERYFRARGYGGRRGGPGAGGRDTYRPISRSRSRSPVRRGERVSPRRRSPSYERGGAGYRQSCRSRSRRYSVRSSRSRTRSLTPRSRSRSASYSSYSRYSRSRSRSASGSCARRSFIRDDIRDSRSRSPAPKD